MNLGHGYKVWEIKTLKRKPKEEEARKMLERVAKQVEPIMRKHKLSVKLLSEFCPEDDLLGFNTGAGTHVQLRLRRWDRDDEFLPFHKVRDTMLHELCHNVYGPHNASFYNLWNLLRKELEDLTDKGLSGLGQGFDLPVQRLAGASLGPQKRRRESDEKEFTSIDFTKDEKSPTKKYGKDLYGKASTSSSIPSHDPMRSEVYGAWQCTACTLFNPPSAPICCLCSTQKPEEFNPKTGIWSCRICTLENDAKVDECVACGSWRYSYGRPVGA